MGSNRVGYQYAGRGFFYKRYGVSLSVDKQNEPADQSPSPRLPWIGLFQLSVRLQGYWKDILMPDVVAL